MAVPVDRAPSGAGRPSEEGKRYAVYLCPDCGEQQTPIGGEAHIGSTSGHPCPSLGKVFAYQAVEVVPAASLGRLREVESLLALLVEHPDMAHWFDCSTNRNLPCDCGVKRARALLAGG